MGPWSWSTPKAGRSGVVDEAACHGVDRFTRVGEVANPDV